MSGVALTEISPICNLSAFSCGPEGVEGLSSALGRGRRAGRRVRRRLRTEMADTSGLYTTRVEESYA